MAIVHIKNTTLRRVITVAAAIPVAMIILPIYFIGQRWLTTSVRTAYRELKEAVIIAWKGHYG